MQNLSYDLRCTLSSLGCIPVARKMFFLTGIRVRPSIIPGDLLYALLQARVLHYLHSVQYPPKATAASWASKMFQTIC